MSTQPLLGVSACLFRADQVLLVERRNAPFAGLFSLPGGRVEFGERLEAAIEREVREETGLSIERFVFVCLHEAIDTDVHVVIAVHRAAEGLRAGVEAEAGDDARSAKLVPIETLAAMTEAGQLTSGLKDIVDSAYRAHLLGL